LLGYVFVHVPRGSDLVDYVIAVGFCGAGCLGIGVFDIQRLVPELADHFFYRIKAFLEVKLVKGIVNVEEQLVFLFYDLVV
jgi:hypothetical protein